MEPVLVLARTGLALVLGTAGLAKVADRAGSRQAMLDFGVQEKLAGPLAIALPVLELIIAVALIPAVTAQAAGVSAALLFAIFLGAMGYQLARGRHPDCHCFGQLHSQPIGPATVVRNTALLLLAVAVVAYPAPSWGSGFSWIAATSTRDAVVLGAIVLIAALLAGEGWMLLNLARQQGRLLLRLDAIEAQLDGKVVPDQPGRSRAHYFPACSASLQKSSLGQVALQLRALTSKPDHCIPAPFNRAPTNSKSFFRNSTARGLSASTTAGGTSFCIC